MTRGERSGEPPPVRGWLAVFCLLLIVWQPFQIALLASSALDELSIRGAPLVAALGLRLLVAAFGVGAGLALVNRRPGAVSLAKASLVASAAIDTFTYTTSYIPSSRFPGDAPLWVAASLAYHAAWFLYLMRSTRVRATFGDDANGQRGHRTSR